MAMVIQFDKFAQQLVESTSFLLGGRIVNIMDKEGCIIASTEKHRINTMHQGAVEAMNTGQEVCIYPDEVGKYPGAKEGINMPIIIKDDIIGVVGVFGNPDQSRDIANLLKVYTEIYISQLNYNNKQELAEGIRLELLNFMIYGEIKGTLSFEQMTNMVGWQCIPPYTCMIMRIPFLDDPVSRNVKMRNLLHKFRDMDFMDSHSTLYGIVDDSVVIIKSDSTPKSIKRLSERLLDLGKREFATTPGIAVSTSYNELDKMPMAYKGISIMTENDSRGILYMDSADGRVAYRLNKICDILSLQKHDSICCMLHFKLLLNAANN